ncbi:MAG: response regulator [Deltaproteobacteria bacterium]|nr:response regulator [Deltaproteobacteria bacterium]
MSALPLIYFERLLEDSPDIIVAVDRHGRIIFFNDGARTALGYSSSEVLGRHVQMFYPSLDDARSVMAAMRDPLIDSPGKVRNFQTTFVTHTGERVAVAISGALIYDETGAESGSIGFAKDLREIHRQDQLATLEEIAVSVAHEVNNPLTAILNNLSLLGSEIRVLGGTDQPCDVELERIDSIESSVTKIQTIVNRLSAMAGARRYGTREYLPGTRMVDLSSDDVSRAATPQPRATAPTSGELPLRGLHVLVVDDDLAVCHSVGDVLRAQGCDVETATSGAHARDLVDERPFDLVLSDVVMPDVDGYDLFMFIRERHPETPVVLMTAFFYDRDHIIKRSKINGLDGVLFKKPIEPARLVEIVRERCGR